MGDENLHPDANQNQPAEELWLQSAGYHFAETTAQLIANKTEEQRHQADDNKRQRQQGEIVVSCTGKGYANGQCIDAGGNGQKKLCLEVPWIDAGMLLFFERIGNHLRADQRQHAKGDPVVDRLDISAETGGQKPAGKRHQGLEKAKEESDTHHRAAFETAHDDPAYDGNRKTIHGKGQGDEK